MLRLIWKPNPRCLKARSLYLTLLFSLTMVSSMASDRLVFAPKSQIVAMGEECLVGIRIHASEAAVVVPDLKLAIDPGLDFLGFEPALSDFRFFVEPGSGHDPDTHRITLVEGQPNPGFLGFGLRSAVLRFKADHPGDYHITPVFQTDTQDDCHIFRLGNPPVDGLGDVGSATITVVQGPVRTWAFPKAHDSASGEFFMLTGDQDCSAEVWLHASDGTIKTHLPGLDWKAHTRPRISFDQPPEHGDWIRVRGAGLLCGCAVFEHAEQETLFAYSASQPACEIFVPHVAQRVDQFFTQAYLASDGTDMHDIGFHYDQGTLPLNLPERGTHILDFNATFPQGLPQGLEWGVVWEPDFGMGLFGMEVFGKTHIRQTTALSLDGQASNSVWFTHVARNLSVFWTGMVIANASRSSNEVTLTPYSRDGQALAMASLNLASREKITILFQADADGQPQTITSPPIDLALPPNTDYVEVNGERAVVGYALFGDRNDQYLAGFQTAKSPSAALAYPVVASGENRWTGFALLNTSDEPLMVAISVMDDAGSALKNLELSLNARERVLALDTAFFDGQPLPDEATQVRIQQVTVGAHLAGFQLLGDLGERTMLAGLLATGYASEPTQSSGLRIELPNRH